jgi:hypothetical protein
MNFKEMKFISRLFLISWLSTALMSRMVIKTQSQSNLQIKEQENHEIKENQTELNMPIERSLAEVQTVNTPPERELKEKKKNKTKVVKKMKKFKNRKLNLKTIKFEKKEDKKKFKELKKILKKHGADIEKISNKKIQQIIEKKHQRGRKLWYWWWRRRQEQLRRQRIHRANIRRTLSSKERSFTLKMQKNKLKQLDRNKFDRLMQKEQKTDGELWSRTFIYDAILLTEKLIYLEHEKMFKNQMKLAINNETKAVSKLDKMYNKNYGKKISELKPSDIEQDIFM